VIEKERERERGKEMKTDGKRKGNK